MNFISDNATGASPQVMAALAAANTGMAGAYGTDVWTKRVEAQFSAVFERDVSVHLAATGTGANALALACLVEPFQAILCHEEAHIVDDECGAPEFFTHGAKLITMPGIGSKLSPDTVAARLAGLSRNVKQMQPAALSISQATECGLIYTPQEVAALAHVAHARGLKLHMDGARFANAVAALGCSPADITWRSGVDVLCFGGTKNGAWAAEAVIYFDPSSQEASQMPWRRKRGGHTLSKGRFVAAQFEALLAEHHWLALARHANRMAARLAAGFAALPGVRLAWPCQANEVFPILPAHVHAGLKAAGAVYNVWSDAAMAPSLRPASDHVVGRFVTAFSTQESDVEGLINAAKAVA